MNRTLTKSFFALGIVLLAGLVLFSGWQVVLILLSRQQEKVVKQQMLAYKPKQTNSEHTLPYSGIQQAQTLNPDIAGWITIPGTGVDYAFVQTKNNTDYLRKDLYGRYALAGTIFLDSRNSTDFSDSKNILYGHNMKNHSMFGELERYREKEFMARYKHGQIMLEEKWVPFTIFATIQAEHDDLLLYQPPDNDVDLNQVLNHLEKNATTFDPIDWRKGHRLLLLSTCGDDAGQTRLIVAAQMKEA